MFEKITESDIAKHGMAAVSTTPNRQTAFGESGMSAPELKARFDSLPSHIAERLNEIFEGIKNGELARAIKISDEKSIGDVVGALLSGDVDEVLIKTIYKTVTLAALGAMVVEMYDGLSTGDLASKIMLTEKESISEFAERIKALAGNYTANIKYALSADGKYYICTGYGSAVCTDIIIAPMVDGIPVSKIEQKAFYKSKITSVFVPSSIAGLPKYAFQSCSNLRSVTLSKGLTVIETSAFQYCGELTDINLPIGLKEIGPYAFQTCDELPYIFIPKTVKTIGAKAFQNCWCLNIYCEAESKPEGWDEEWNYTNRPVTWGCSLEAVQARFAEISSRLDALEGKTENTEGNTDAVQTLQ